MCWQYILRKIYQEQDEGGDEPCIPDSGDEPAEIDAFVILEKQASDDG